MPIPRGLTNTQARQCRTEFCEGKNSINTLAWDFGLSYRAMWMLIHHQTYQDAGGPMPAPPTRRSPAPKKKLPKRATKPATKTQPKKGKKAAPSTAASKAAAKIVKEAEKKGKKRKPKDASEAA